MIIYNYNREIIMANNSWRDNKQSIRVIGTPIFKIKIKWFIMSKK